MGKYNKPRPPATTLTEKQRKFVELYTNPASNTYLNAKKTAYLSHEVTNDNSAAVVGSQTLNTLNVKTAIDRALGRDKTQKEIAKNITKHLRDSKGKDWIETLKFISRALDLYEDA
jgi:hypothetical protein